MEQVDNQEAQNKEPNNEEPHSQECQKLISKVKNFIETITVEPVLICFVLPKVMSNLTIQNLNLDKACRVNLGIPPETCDAMMVRDVANFNRTEEIEVQKLVATMEAYRNIIQSFFPCLLLLFIGSWSDRRKRRKPCLLWPISGEILACFGLLISVFFYMELPMEFNVFFAAIASSITGGWYTIFMGCLTYVGEVSKQKARTLRMGAVNITANISYTIGFLLGGALFQQIGFYGIFSLALMVYLVGFFYGIVFVNEVPQSTEAEEKNGIALGVKQSSQKDDAEKVANKEENSRRCLRNFFDWTHVVETFKMAFQQSEKRNKICAIIVLCMVLVGPVHGESGVRYLFVRYKFNWNEVDYSIYIAFHVITHLFGTFFSLMFFTKFLKLDDSILGMASTASRIAASLVYAFAPSSLVFYLGAVVEIMNGTSMIAMRSMISKLVPSDQLGKINSLIGLADCLVPMFYGPMYSLIYKHTIDFLPGAFFIAGAFLIFPALCIFCWFYWEHRKEVAKAEIKAGQQNNDA